MRQTALLLVIAVLGNAAIAQFTFRPQIGIENPMTKISYNDLSYFKPISQFAPQLGIHADYKFKSGFGPFIGLSTSRPSLKYSFSDPETGMTTYHATVGKMQFQFLGGLQYSSNPLALTKKAETSKTESKTKSTNKSGCSYYSSSCCSKSKLAEKAKPKKDIWTMRLQPVAGLAYMPSNKPDIETKSSGTQTSYIYNADFKTALVTGMGFEFSRNKNKFLTLSFNYFKGLGNDETTFSAQSGTKTVITNLRSKLSGWNAVLGIPISFTKSTVTKTKKEHRSCEEYYKIRCQSIRKI